MVLTGPAVLDLGQSRPAVADGRTPGRFHHRGVNRPHRPAPERRGVGLVGFVAPQSPAAAGMVLRRASPTSKSSGSKIGVRCCADPYIPMISYPQSTYTTWPVIAAAPSLARKSPVAPSSSAVTFRRNGDLAS